jgi:hypothetical protein
LDAFVDDIDELRDLREIAVRPIPGSYPPAVDTWIGEQPLRIEIFRVEGVARFRLLEDTPPPRSGETVGLAAAFGGVLGAAVGAASEKKENLLGGLVLGLLIGGLLGAVASQPPVERALAMRFDPASSTWRLYDGPLLTWAKSTLGPPLAG